MNTDLDSFLERCRAYFSLPQLSIAMINNDSGHTALDLVNQFNEPHIYKVGSLTKLVTGLAILHLEDKGLLSVNDKVSKHLEWFNKKTSKTIDVSVKIIDLLLHTANLARGFFIRHDPTVEEVIKYFNEIEPTFSTYKTKKYNYSNVGYILLGLIISRVSNQSYEAYIHENIFSPLEMTNSGFGNNSNYTITTAHNLSYLSPKNKTPYDCTECPLFSAPYAAFDMFSTVKDFLELISCLLNNGELRNEKVFSPDVVHKFRTLTFFITSKVESKIGLLETKSFMGPIQFQNAEHWGHSASILVIPERKVAILAFVNRGSAANELWFVIQKVAKYFIHNKDSKYLNFHYQNSHEIVGNYVSEDFGAISVVVEEKELYVLYENKKKSLLAYKGNNSFFLENGILSKYTIVQDFQNKKSKGLIIGPYYFRRNDTQQFVKITKKYASITGIYFNRSVGKVALFERDNQLIITFSPLKEAILEELVINRFVQRTGPFVNEIVQVNSERKELTIGKLTFNYTNQKY